MLPPKYEITMVLSIHSFFQYCNIGLFFIAPCKVITLNPFWYQFFAPFLMALSLKLSLLLLFLALKGDSKILLLLFANAFKSVKERQLLLSQSWKSDN